MIKNFLILLIIFLLFLFMLHKGLERAEKIECQKWLEWERNFKDFYWTDWQLEQCQKFGIIRQK